MKITKDDNEQQKKSRELVKMEQVWKELWLIYHASAA